MSKLAARLTLFCAIVGLGASAAALYVHYHLLTDPAYVSACDINETFSCSQIYLSRFSTVGGVPVAIGGAAWFAVAGLLAIAGLTAPEETRQNVASYLFGLSTLALAVVLYFGYVSFVVLKAACVFCLTMDAAVVGTFLVSGTAASVPMGSLPRRAVRDLGALASSPLALALTVLLAGGVAASAVLFPREAVLAAAASAPASAASAAPATAGSATSEFDRWYASQPRVDVPVSRDAATVLVVKFNDFECPACSDSYEKYKSIFAKYDAERPGQVKLVLKDFPLDATCNDTLTQTVHAAACQAAVAVRLAREHGEGDALEDWFYTNQESMTAAVVKEQAARVGHVADFDARYEATLAEVKADIALGRRLQVRATPTFFINGVKIEGEMPPQYFDQAIAYELQHGPSR